MAAGMSMLRRTPALVSPGDSPVTVPDGRAVLHLFARAGDAFDAASLAHVVLAARAAGTDVVVFSVLGHKAHLGFMLLDPDLWALRRMQAQIEGAGADIVNSFLSITEVSEYADGLPAAAKRHRLHPALPPDGARVLAFYPMIKRRQGEDNWYALDFEERSRLMHDHGRLGRHHAGKVVQLVTASTGLDDWEWGVTLFAAEPAAIKAVVYELRFDEVSTRFAEFGPFTIGLICDPHDLARLIPDRGLA
jgi:chlorite dismutase